jgi:glycine/D-amino acid oxidase-like deaminating enzyme
MEMWHNIESIAGGHCGFHASGPISVAENSNDLRVLERRLAIMRSAGYQHEELVDRAEFLKLVPSISPHCVGALVARRDGAADPHRTLSAFRRIAEAAGIEIHEGTGVVAVDRVGSDWKVRTSEREFTAPTVISAIVCGWHWCGGNDIPSDRSRSSIFTTSIPFEQVSFALSGSRVSARSEEHCQYEAVKIENAKDIP